MKERRNVCGWCPLELPEDPTEWYHHFLVEHGSNGYSVRHYEVRTLEEELAELPQQ